MLYLHQHFVVVYNKIKTLVLNSFLLIIDLVFSMEIIFLFGQINLYDFHYFIIYSHFKVIIYLNLNLYQFIMICFTIMVIIYAIIFFIITFIVIFIIFIVTLINSYVIMFLFFYLFYHI